MASIRGGGGGLKKRPPAPAPAPAQASGDARNELLEAIRGGKILRKVEKPKERPPMVTEEPPGIMGGNLVSSMLSRRAALEGSSDESSDDWDD